MNKHINFIFTLIGFLLMATFISACVVTKKYEAPEISETDYLFRLDSLAQENNEPFEIEQWREFFTDSILVSYIDTALVHNNNNQIALKTIEKFNAQFKQGRAKQLPTIDAGASIQRQQQAENSQFGSFFSEPFTNHDFSGTISWEADIWGKINSQRLASKARFSKSITAQQTVQTLLIANIANTYYQLLSADKRKELLIKTVKIRQESVETQKALKESGQTNSVSVSLAKSQLLQAQVLLNDVENLIFTLENELVLLTGKSTRTIERSSLDAQASRTDFQVGLPMEVLSNRPDVKEAELDFRSFFEEYNVAKAAMYPNIRLSASAGFQSLAFSSWIDPSSLFNTLTAGVTQPIFNGRQLRTQKEVAKIDMEQSLLRFQQTVLNASLEVSNLLKTQELTTAKLNLLTQQESALNQSFADSKALLDAGLTNYLDVLIAQGNLLDVQLQHLATTSVQLQNEVNIFRALGGGIN